MPGIRLHGPGAIYAKRTDVANATPVNFGKVKEFSLDTTKNVKELTGQYAAALDFGGGTWKIAGKVKVAEVSPLVIASLFYGITPTAGSTLTQFMEATAIPASAPYTVAPANAATFVEEREVINLITGLPFVKVSSGPLATGTYLVNATTGVFTFGLSDHGVPIAITYDYTSTGGYSLNVNNQLQGDIPKFSVIVYNTKNGLPINYTVPMCVMPSMKRSFKENDWLNPEYDLMVGADAGNRIIIESYPQLS